MVQDQILCGMVNEYQNNVSKKFAIARGKHGPLSTYCRLTLLKNNWNKRMYHLYNKPKFEQQKKECGFSQKLWMDMMQLLNEETNCIDLNTQLHDKGIAIIEDYRDKAERHAQKQLMQEQIEITDESTLFPDRYYQRLREYADNVTNNREYGLLLSKREHLQKIRRLFWQQYNSDYLERRLNSIGYYFI